MGGNGNDSGNDSGNRVVVAGAGPVGLMLAGELRLGGAEVVVLERLATPTTESRASTVHARSMEILDQRGLLARLGTPPRELKGHFGGLPFDLSGQPTRYQGQWKIPQARLEALLTEWATGLGADIRREHQVSDVDERPDGVVVRADTPDGPVRYTAGYLVGCDGEDSTVRRLAGFAFPGTPATRELLRCDVTGVAVPDRRFERLPNGLAIAATRAGVTRVMVHEYGRAPAARATAPDFAEVAETWARVTGEDIRSGTPVWVNAFDDTARLVEGYRRGRVLLAGDAAHRQLPVGGQALNLGLQEAVNLGWKLAMTVAGRAPAGLLDSYHEERHPVARRVLASVGTQALLLFGGAELDPVRALLAELLEQAPEHFGRTAGGLDIRYGDDVNPLTGARLPHVELGTGDGPSSSTSLLRTGRGVLLDLSGESGRLAAAAAPWRERVDLVPAVPPPGSPVDGLATVLLRPDGHVAMAAGRDADPRPALRRWFGG
ncbi:FAD-dependent monooxygenase [Amycolatopsis nigrescens]|uniref:FAD-dependent monooxygenase n=1 Tax=Amycolatopsis nigrescens TaxID=381445 RepID=UPI0003A3C1D2|nr:FAD-dependent monooxygenase [Amycolatopsis nigrescens]